MSTLLAHPGRSSSGCVSLSSAPFAVVTVLTDCALVLNCNEQGPHGGIYLSKNLLSLGGAVLRNLTELSDCAILPALVRTLLPPLVACRSEFVTADAAGGVRVFPLDRASIGGVGVDVAAKFAS